MNYAAGLFLSMCVAASLSACKGKTDVANMANHAAELAQTAAKNVEPAQPAAHEFDINQVPLSHVALGDFPYISLPQGYSNDGRAHQTLDFARFPFWVGNKPVWVEGKLYGTSMTATEGKQFSQLEVRRNVEAMVAELGGKEVFQGKIPYDTIKSWGSDVLGLPAFGDPYNEPVTTYVVHREDGNLWIYFVANTAEAWWTVVKEKSFQKTASLLPASELKQQLDSAGKVALQVNFATDKTEILADSQPQIAQVLQLLKENNALKLAINGHTDNSGDAAHNQTLSEGRAAAVVAALVAQGIAGSRLAAHGYGASQPVADNATPEGKAKNRRVELVKQ